MSSSISVLAREFPCVDVEVCVDCGPVDLLDVGGCPRCGGSLKKQLYIHHEHHDAVENALTDLVMQSYDFEAEREKQHLAGLGRSASTNEIKQLFGQLRRGL